MLYLLPTRDFSFLCKLLKTLKFVEVFCRSSGKIRHFSVGTEAGFAVNYIKKKLISDGDGGVKGILQASHIEAVKEDEEESVSFCPNSVLVNYRPGWKLQTVVHSYGDKGRVHVGPTRGQKTSAKTSPGSKKIVGFFY